MTQERLQEPARSRLLSFTAHRRRDIHGRGKPRHHVTKSDSAFHHRHAALLA